MEKSRITPLTGGMHPYLYPHLMIAHIYLSIIGWHQKRYYKIHSAPSVPNKGLPLVVLAYLSLMQLHLSVVMLYVLVPRIQVSSVVCGL